MPRNLNTTGRLSSVSLPVPNLIHTDHTSYSLYKYTPPKLEKACILKRQKNQPWKGNGVAQIHQQLKNYTERTALEMGRQNLDSKEGNGYGQSVSHATHRKKYSFVTLCIHEKCFLLLSSL